MRRRVSRPAAFLFQQPQFLCPVPQRQAQPLHIRIPGQQLRTLGRNLPSAARALTGEASLRATIPQASVWSITDVTVKVNAGWSSWLGTFDPHEENWPLSIYTPPPDWSLLFEGLGDMWVETTRFLDLLSEAESLTEFLAGAGYLTGFTSEGQSETRFAISAAGVIRFDAASATEFVPQLSPATPNFGSGVIVLPPSRHKNYGF